MTPYRIAAHESALLSEREDCTVKALSIALDIPYWVAHEKLRMAGRKVGKPFNLINWLNPLTDICGYKIMRWNANGHTLSQVLKNCAKGRFILRKSGHVFAMIDGMVHDRNTNNNAKIYQVWKFVKEESCCT